MAEVNPNIEILEDYVKDGVKLKCRCLICGFEWESCPSNLLQGKGCKICHFNKMRIDRRKDISVFKEEMSNINPNIEIVGEYINSQTKIECKCLLHNETFYMKPTHLLKGENGCKTCLAEKLHLTGLKPHQQFVQELKNVNPHVEVIGEYTGAQRRVEVKCLRCGHVWTPIAYSLLAGFGCPSCNTSKGENAIKDYLDQNNLNYEQQKKFDDLRGTGNLYLSYDFYLSDYNLLIEYQGQQHEKPVEYFGGDKHFKTQKEHDLRKKNYALQHNYNFLEIWYYDFKNIESILRKELQELKNPVTITA